VFLITSSFVRRFSSLKNEKNFDSSNTEVIFKILFYILKKKLYFALFDKPILLNKPKFVNIDKVSCLKFLF
jgi:hypothetical protein